MVRFPASLSRAVSACFAILFFLAGSVQGQAIDTSAPEIGVPALDGTSIQLSELEGQVVVVDFWASWCGPCREELPFLVELSQELADLPVTFLAINLDEQDDLREGLLRSLKLELPFVQIHDPAGSTAKAFELVAMPTTLVIDSGGIIRYRHTGFQKRYRDELRSAISNLIPTRP
jgi:thiol-disulfide isomerase/thioredoxin